MKRAGLIANRERHLKSLRDSLKQQERRQEEVKAAHGTLGNTTLAWDAHYLLNALRDAQYYLNMIEVSIIEQTALDAAEIEHLKLQN